MDIKDIKNNSIKDLGKLLQDKRSELRELRFKVNARQLSNVQHISIAKKDIAKILTLINKKKIEQARTA